MSKTVYLRTVKL